MLLCTSDILGKLEQIPCRDRKGVTGGVKNLQILSWGRVTRCESWPMRINRSICLP